MDNKLEILFSAGVKYKDIYYLAAAHMNALFMYDERKNKLTFLTSFKKERSVEYLYLKTFLYKNEAWFIPYSAEHIAIVNLETFSVRYISLLYKKEYCNLKYINIMCFEDDYLCLVPIGVDAAMIIDLKSGRTRAYYGIAEVDKNYCGAAYWKGKIYFFPWRAEDILVLDLKTDRCMYLPWNEGKESYGDVVLDEKTGNLFHAPARENNILLGSLHNRRHEKIKIGNWEDRECRTYYFTNSKYGLFFWGHEKDIILKIENDGLNVRTYQIVQHSVGKYFFPIFSDDIEALVFDGNCIIKYDVKNDKFIDLYMYTTARDFMEEINRSGISYKDIFLEDDITVENKLNGLQYFMVYVMENERAVSNQPGMNIGIEIYNKVRDMYYK